MRNDLVFSITMFEIQFYNYRFLEYWLEYILFVTR